MTHSIIKSKLIRTAYAMELSNMRPLIRAVTPEERWALLIGLESGFWAMQKKFAEIGL